MSQIHMFQGYKLHIGWYMKQIKTVYFFLMKKGQKNCTTFHAILCHPTNSEVLSKNNECDEILDFKKLVLVGTVKYINDDRYERSDDF